MQQLAKLIIVIKAVETFSNEGKLEIDEQLATINFAEPSVDKFSANENANKQLRKSCAPLDICSVVCFSVYFNLLTRMSYNFQTSSPSVACPSGVDETLLNSVDHGLAEEPSTPTRPLPQHLIATDPMTNSGTTRSVWLQSMLPPQSPLLILSSMSEREVLRMHDRSFENVERPLFSPLPSPSPLLSPSPLPSSLPLPAALSLPVPSPPLWSMQQYGSDLSEFSVSLAVLQLEEEEALAHWLQEIADYECPPAA